MNLTARFSPQADSPALTNNTNAVMCIPGSLSMTAWQIPKNSQMPARPVQCRRTGSFAARRQSWITLWRSLVRGLVDAVHQRANFSTRGASVTDLTD